MSKCSRGKGKTKEHTYYYNRTYILLQQNIHITTTKFNENYPLAQLHYIIADKDSCIVVETIEDGMHIYDNKVGVLTNNSYHTQYFSFSPDLFRAFPF